MLAIDRCLWFLLAPSTWILCQATFPERTTGSLHVINQKSFPMAAAIDGSPPIYYARPAVVDSSKRKWVIHLEGGDFCGYGNSEAEQLEDCYRRSQMHFGSSRAYSTTKDISSYSQLFTDSQKGNPLAYGWNWIFIPYLDGGYYAGSRVDTPVVNGTALHFRGAFNIEAIVATLSGEQTFKHATDVVLSGCSSGGLGVIANADHLYHSLQIAAPSASVSTFVDSGYYLNVNTTYWTKPVFRMQHIGRTLSAPCMESRRISPWDCIVADVAAPFVKRMPLFVAESRYDTNQLECVNIDPENVSAINAYGARLQAAVMAWASGTGLRGGFVDGCSRHCSITAGIATTDGVTAMDAFASFHSGKHHPVVTVQHGAYPCQSCCGANVVLL